MVMVFCFDFYVSIYKGVCLMLVDLFIVVGCVDLYDVVLV